MLVALSLDIQSEGKSILDSSNEVFESVLKRAFDTRISNFGNKLFCYSPTSYPYQIDDHRIENPHKFVSLSVTGLSCSLNCDHCQSRLLKGMISSRTPDAMISECKFIKKKGGTGVLISGGADSTGHVPLDRFGDAISLIKKQLGLKVVVHTGLLDEPTVSMLAEANIDAAMLDVIGSTDVAKRIYHIDDGPKRIRESLVLLNEHGIPVVPHVLVGLDYGKINGELEALSMLSSFDIAGVVIIALSPIRGTPMEKAPPPSPNSIARILTITRLGFPDIPVLLGCARPIGAHKIESDKYAILAGVNGIAYISQEGVDFARTKKLHPVFRDICCSLAFQSL
ncbi:MAG: Biotin synthase [Candidatus Thorarchaeota archaeon]|nr:MAG: Biotin synthase [Candidatus Thorarchaeota archaeon]